MSRTLPDKVAELKGKGLEAVRLAMLWEQYIDLHGEQKAVEFYKHIGLNHLETKSIEWEGLTLSREPSEVEKLCIKSISQAQDAGKASVLQILLQTRSALIDEALKAIKKLTPATYHELILTVPDKFQSELRDQVGKVFMKGKRLVDAELSKQGKSARYAETKQAEPTEEDDSELDDLTSLTGSRVSNELQARIASAASRFALLGLTGKALWDAVSKEVGDGSTGWLDRIATGATNKVLNFGRLREAEDRKDEWDNVEYSAILDQNVCDPCASEDGQSASSESDLQPVPNPDCAGGDWCRCFHVFVLDTVA